MTGYTVSPPPVVLVDATNPTIEVMRRIEQLRSEGKVVVVDGLPERMELPPFTSVGGEAVSRMAYPKIHELGRKRSHGAKARDRDERWRQRRLENMKMGKKVSV